MGITPGHEPLLRGVGVAYVSETEHAEYAEQE
jgi:hypothetical protein